MYAFRSLQLKITLGDFFFSCALEIQLLNSNDCWIKDAAATMATAHDEHCTFNTQRKIVLLLFRKVPILLKCHTSYLKNGKKTNVFIVNIHNGTFCHSSLADCYYWGCHRCHAIAVLIKHWKCLRFFSHSHFICLLCFFCYFLLCGKGLQKTLNKTHCYCFKLHFASVIHSFVWISVYQVSIWNRIFKVNNNERKKIESWFSNL